MATLTYVREESPSKLLPAVVLDAFVHNTITVSEHVEDPRQLTPELTGRIPEAGLHPLVNIPHADVHGGDQGDPDIPQVPVTWVRVSRE